MLWLHWMVDGVRLCSIVCVCDHVEERVGTHILFLPVDVVTSLGRPATGLGRIGGASVIGGVSMFVVRVCLLSCGRSSSLLCRWR
jgi:hypothetical protein